jgi:hypothetical protein
VLCFWLALWGIGCKRERERMGTGDMYVVDDGNVADVVGLVQPAGGVGRWSLLVFHIFFN